MWQYPHSASKSEEHFFNKDEQMCHTIENLSTKQHIFEVNKVD